MRTLIILGLGIGFGIIMSRSEAISWFRIFEMFRFESFHMYGIIGVAIATGILGLAILKRLAPNADTFQETPLSIPRHLIAGTVFGLGWAMTGACPGPIFVLFGHGVWNIVWVFLGAIIGTLLYGRFRNLLIH